MTASQGVPHLELKSKPSSQHPVTRVSGSSHEVEPPFGVLRSAAVPPYWLSGPSSPFLRPGGLPAPHLGIQNQSNTHPPWGLLSSSEYDQIRLPPQGRLLFTGFVPFSDIRTGGPLLSGLPHPTPSAFRVSHPLDGFLPPVPLDLVSCRYRSGVLPSGPFPLA